MNFGIKDIKEITTSMSAYSDMDYSNYALSFLKRRLSYLFAQLNIRKIESFYEMLENSDFREQILYHMCVDATEMFRDPPFWRTLRDKIFENLPKKAEHIWLPVAASGEEAFSLAILLHENNLTQKYNIIVSTPSCGRCENIHNGKINSRHDAINQSNYKRLEDKNSYNKYIFNENGFSILDQKYRQNIECRQQAFPFVLPSEDNIGLILFRNISIYYNPKLSQQAFQLLIDKLMPGGFLVIGTKEQLPEIFREELIEIDPSEKIYKKPDFKQKYHAEY